jgi:cardiolipin synthase
MASAGFLILGLFIGILSLIGFLNAVRGTPVKRVKGFLTNLPPVTDPAFRATMELVSHAEMTPGNHVDVYWNGDQTYPALWRDLRDARQSIVLQLYYLKVGRMADELVEILIDRASAGVRVLFLYDAFGTARKFKRRYLKRLRDAGVRAEPFRPLGVAAINKLQHRAHIRVVCVDGEIGWTGGFGIDDKWYGNGRTKDQWRDSNVRFTGPAVSQLWGAFAACWAESTGELLVSKAQVRTETDGGKSDGVLAGVLHGSPSVGSTEAERFFVYAIASAREKLYVANSYFVPDRDIRALLVDAARRGVDTRVLTVSDTTDIKSTWYAGRARYEHLLKGGVRIYEYQPVMMHAKTLVVDGHYAAVGSMNADNRSLSLNEETVLMALDAGVARTVERHFLDDLQHAKEITLDEFRRRPWIDRVKENVCYSFWRIL